MATTHSKPLSRRLFQTIKSIQREKSDYPAGGFATVFDHRGVGRWPRVSFSRLTKSVIYTIRFLWKMVIRSLIPLLICKVVALHSYFQVFFMCGTPVSICAAWWLVCLVAVGCSPLVRVWQWMLPIFCVKFDLSNYGRSPALTLFSAINCADIAQRLFKQWPTVLQWNEPFVELARDKRTEIRCMLSRKWHNKTMEIETLG